MSPSAASSPISGSAPRITVVEVGPRDGLQSEAAIVATGDKIRFIEALADAGLPVIEATSFVHPKAVPQLADADHVMTSLSRRQDVRYPVLIPNERGLDRALAAGVTEIALFTAATDAFAQANVATSIDGTFERFAPVVARALAADLWVRGYVSVAFGCPYAGAVSPAAVTEVAVRLIGLGCAEVCLADTIGVAQPDDVDRVLAAVLAETPPSRIALHFHDTGGRALANVERALGWMIETFDAAAGGLGGCPFAPGAPGNLATEVLVRFFDGRGLPTGVDAAAVAQATATLRAALAAETRPGSDQPSPGAP